MTLSDSQLRYLKKQVHHLKPVVIIGQSGLSENVLKELDSSLEHHELMKVRINAADREARNALLVEICDALSAQAVQMVGHVASLYRKKRQGKSRIALPR